MNHFRISDSYILIQIVQKSEAREIDHIWVIHKAVVHKISNYPNYSTIRRFSIGSNFYLFSNFSCECSWIGIAIVFNSSLSTSDSRLRHSRSSRQKSPSRNFANHQRAVRSDVMFPPHALMSFRVASALLWPSSNSWNRTTRISVLPSSSRTEIAEEMVLEKRLKVRSMLLCGAGSQCFFLRSFKIISYTTALKKCFLTVCSMTIRYSLKILINCTRWNIARTKTAIIFVPI